MSLSILDNLHQSLAWPEPGQVFNPSGAGPAAYSRLAKSKIQLPLELELGKGQVQVGILAGNPNSDESDAPIALVCEFNNAITPDALNFTRKLAWNFCHAKLLITIEPQLIRTWSCYEKPDDQTGKFPLSPITSEGDRTTFNIDSLVDTLHWIQLASGRYFTVNQRYFDRDQRADTTLLKNLGYVRRKLTSDLTDDIAHDLLARVVFLQFLFDRKDSGGTTALNERKLSSLRDEGVLTNKHVGLTSILRHKADTFALFKWLNVKFNGDLFPKSLASEEKIVKKHHLETLAEFVSGKIQLEDGHCQYMLWPYYSFDTIPLEFISSIYEEFVTKRDDEEDGTGIGEHYTRPFLVDFLLDKVLPWSGTDYDKKILDPCCGSAVFLVKAFQRLVQRWRNANPGMEPSASFLRGLLEKNLFGVDTNPNAIHVASFSLYLAMCDEIDPKHYWSQVRFPSLRGNRIKHADFFSEDIVEISSDIKEENKYDLVVGNAPWGKESLTEKAKEWAGQYGWQPVDKQSGTLFLAKATMLCKNTGHICMIQPAGALLFNVSSTAQSFRNKLFSSYKVDEVVNLSALRFLDIFPNAVGPAAIINLRTISPNGEPISYCSPKQTFTNEEQHRVVIDSLDYNWIWPEEASEDPIVWPALMWGGRRDYDFIQGITRKYHTLKHYIDNHEWDSQRGFQRGTTEAEERNEYLGQYILEKSTKTQKNEIWDAWSDLPKVLGLKSFPKNINPMFSVIKSLEEFKVPVVVIKNSWPVLTQRFDAKMIVSNDSKHKSHGGYLLYSQSFFGFMHPDVSKLTCLTVISNSKFAVYYFYLTSGRLASYRPTLRKEDFENIPIPPSANIDLKKISQMNESEIDSTANKLYHFNDVEQVLMDNFFNITLKDFKETNNKPGYKKIDSGNINSESLNLYCEWFLQVLKSGFGNDKHICATIFQFDSGNVSPFNIVAIHFDWPRKKLVDYKLLEKTELFNKLNELEQVQKEKDDQKTIFYNRVSRIYQTVKMEENGEIRKVPTVFLIKPNQVRYWTRSVALRDADEVAFDIMQWAEFEDVKRETVLDAQR